MKHYLLIMEYMSNGVWWISGSSRVYGESKGHGGVISMIPMGKGASVNITRKYAICVVRSMVLGMVAVLDVIGMLMRCVYVMEA